jgi:plastocyanin
MRPVISAMQRRRIILVALLTLISAVSANRRAESVSIADGQFNPRTVRIAPGDSVEWTNSDDRDHRVVGDGFASGTLRGGDSFRHTFTKAGKYGYACALHPREKGSIVVGDAGN